MMMISRLDTVQVCIVILGNYWNCAILWQRI